MADSQPRPKSMQTMLSGDFKLCQDFVSQKYYFCTGFAALCFQEKERQDVLTTKNNKKEVTLFPNTMNFSCSPGKIEHSRGKKCQLPYLRVFSISLVEAQLSH